MSVLSEAGESESTCFPSYQADCVLNECLSQTPSLRHQEHVRSPIRPVRTVYTMKGKELQGEKGRIIGWKDITLSKIK